MEIGCIKALQPFSTSMSVSVPKVCLCVHASPHFLTSHSHGENRRAVGADSVAGLAVVLAAGSGADLSDGVARA